MLGKVQAILMPPEDDEPPHCAGDGYSHLAALSGHFEGTGCCLSDPGKSGYSRETEATDA